MIPANNPATPSRPCTTHHFACDCREARFAFLLREAVLRWEAPGWWMDEAVSLIEGGRPEHASTVIAPSKERGATIPKFVTPPCDLCSNVSVVMILATHGCTCLANVYQRRCVHHLNRASDTLEDFEVVEDYTVKKIFSQNRTSSETPSL